MDIRNFGLFIPLIIACVIAFAANVLFSPETATLIGAFCMGSVATIFGYALYRAFTRKKQ